MREKMTSIYSNRLTFFVHVRIFKSFTAILSETKSEKVHSRLKTIDLSYNDVKREFVMLHEV